MSKVTRAQQAEADKARDELRAMLPPGSTVYTIVRHVARSGMMRVVDAHAIVDNEMQWLSRRIVLAMPGWERYDDRRQGIRMSGCGMDMGFHLVSSLSRVLYPEGFGCIGERCRSNDHSNGDRDRTPHTCVHTAQCAEVQGCAMHHHWHRSGDYALRHTWI